MEYLLTEEEIGYFKLRIVYIAPGGTKIKPGKVLHFLPEVELVRTAPPKERAENDCFTCSYENKCQLECELNKKLREEEEQYNEMIGWCQ